MYLPQVQVVQPLNGFGIFRNPVQVHGVHRRDKNPGGEVSLILSELSLPGYNFLVGGDSSSRPFLHFPIIIKEAKKCWKSFLNSRKKEPMSEPKS